LTLTRVSDTPLKDGISPEPHGKIINAHLRSEGIEFSATDWLHPTRIQKQGNTVALFISGATYRQLRDIFDRRAAGADTALLDDLRSVPFGTYGHLADKYGVHWFFQGEREGA